MSSILQFTVIINNNLIYCYDNYEITSVSNDDETTPSVAIISLSQIF